MIDELVADLHGLARDHGGTRTGERGTDYATLE
jgi:hypothetical protein